MPKPQWMNMPSESGGRMTYPTHTLQIYLHTERLAVAAVNPFMSGRSVEAARNPSSVHQIYGQRVEWWFRGLIRVINWFHYSLFNDGRLKSSSNWFLCQSAVKDTSLWVLILRPSMPIQSEIWGSCCESSASSSLWSTCSIKERERWAPPACINPLFNESESEHFIESYYISNNSNYSGWAPTWNSFSNNKIPSGANSVSIFFAQKPKLLLWLCCHCDNLIPSGKRIFSVFTPRSQPLIAVMLPAALFSHLRRQHHLRLRPLHMPWATWHYESVHILQGRI